MVLTKDSYRVLGVAPSCSDKDIHSAYRTLSKQWHPDMNPERRDLAHEKMQEVVAAYNLVKNPESRKDYDAQPHYRYRRSLQERGKKPRPRIKVVTPGFLARLLGGKKRATGGPADPVKVSQEHFAMGLSMMESAGFVAGARREFELAAELDSGYVDAHFNVAICCYRQGEFEQCISALQRVLGLDRQDRQALQLIQLLRDQEY